MRFLERYMSNKIHMRKVHKLVYSYYKIVIHMIIIIAGVYYGFKGQYYPA